MTWWNPESALVYSDLDARFRTESAYRRWADAQTGSITLRQGLVDLEDSASVLGLQLRLRHWAELCDRRYFAQPHAADRRQRQGYPGEGWEIACFADDDPDSSVMPTVLVTHPTPRTCHYEFLHAEGFTILKDKKRRVAGPTSALGVFGDVDFGYPPAACSLGVGLRELARDDDDAWFEAHPDEDARERFVCPGEMRLQRHGGPWEYVEVRRLGGLLFRVLMQDGEPAHARYDRLSLCELAPERYAPSRLYPRHGLR